MERETARVYFEGMECLCALAVVLQVEGAFAQEF